MASINRNKKYMILEKRETEYSSIGSEVEIWTKVKEIQVSVYPLDSKINTTIAKYNESTHTGITKYKDIEEGSYRLIDGDIIYSIESTNPKGRQNQLLLKEIKNV